MDAMDVRPIGVFDSGIGGLTVLKELALQFPQESFLYLGTPQDFLMDRNHRRRFVSTANKILIT